MGNKVKYMEYIFLQYSWTKKTDSETPSITSFLARHSIYYAGGGGGKDLTIKIWSSTTVYKYKIYFSKRTRHQFKTNCIHVYTEQGHPTSMVYCVGSNKLIINRKGQKLSCKTY